MYEFKNLNEVEQQDKPTENTTVMAFESGAPKQIPASEFGGSGYVLKPTMDEVIVDESGSRPSIITTNYDDLLKVLEHGGTAWLVYSHEPHPIGVFPMSNMVIGWQYFTRDESSITGFDSAVVAVDTISESFVLTNGSYVPNL